MSHPLAEARDRYWDQLLRLHPLLGTLIGDERYDDELPDLSEQGLADAEGFHSAALDALSRLDPASLVENDRLDAAVMHVIASRELEALALKLDRLHGGSHMGDPWTPCPGTLLSQLGTLSSLTTPEGDARYVSRLAKIPRYLDQAGALLRAGADEGLTLPVESYARTLRQVVSILETRADASPALQPLRSDEARARATDVLAREVLPAYQRYETQLRRALPRARATFGLSGLRQGETLYAAYTKYWLSSPLSAEEVHQSGVADLEEANRERVAVAQRLGFPSPKAAAESYLSSGRSPNTAEELLSRSHAQAKRSWEASRGYFRRRPAANCEVQLVEESRAADYLAYYQPASTDGSRPATYYVSAAELRSRPLHRLAAWTYHEANPGHHFQIALEQEAPERSPLRRFTNDFASSAFVEGWGLYAERLADEMGLYIDDYERLGMLDQQAFRCARLVVDTGIHAFGWSRERAVHVLAANGIPPAEASIEADRYAVLPAQALTYRIGQEAITKWRNALTKGTGRYDLRDFHDRLLALGSLPLPALERELLGSRADLA